MVSAICNVYVFWFCVPFAGDLILLCFHPKFYFLIYKEKENKQLLHEPRNYAPNLYNLSVPFLNLTSTYKPVIKKSFISFLSVFN